MAGESELFAYSEEEQTVFLVSEVRSKILGGLFCPAVSEVPLEFLLTSDILGKATEIISIPFKPHDASAEDDQVNGGSNFAGVDISEVDAALAAQLALQEQ